MTSSISTAEEKERLVLMPLQGSGMDHKFYPAIETAVKEGLSSMYKVKSGKKVAQKVKEILDDISRGTPAGEECDETECLLKIAIELQVELLAIVNIIKIPSGYILSLNIRNAIEDTVVLARSETCGGCDEIQVIKILKKMAGAKPASLEQKPKVSETPVDGMVFIKSGCFQMGDTFGDGDNDENPVHEVCVNDFYMGEHEVTQKEWKEVMGNNPSGFKDCGGDCPVESVSWNDVQQYIRKLNDKTGMKYRLPTEAEWEYAARGGGRKEKYAGTNKKSDLGDYAWYEDNSGRKTHPVKAKQPNSLGPYDMSGNVWEWVSDWYDKNYYRNSPKDNPIGPASGKYKVLRGGSWGSGPLYLRATSRARSKPDERYNGDGFRIAQD